MNSKNVKIYDSSDSLISVCLLRLLSEKAYDGKILVSTENDGKEIVLKCIDESATVARSTLLRFVIETICYGGNPITYDYINESQTMDPDLKRIRHYVAWFTIGV